MKWIVELHSGEKYAYPDYASAYFFAITNFGFMGYYIYEKE